MLAVQAEVTDRMLIFGKRHLRTALAQYESHYNGQRPGRSRRLCPPRPAHPVADLPGSGSSAGRSSAGSSTSTRAPHRIPGRHHRAEFGTYEIPPALQAAQTKGRQTPPTYAGLLITRLPSCRRASPGARDCPAAIEVMIVWPPSIGTAVCADGVMTAAGATGARTEYASRRDWAACVLAA